MYAGTYGRVLFVAAPATLIVCQARRACGVAGAVVTAAVAEPVQPLSTPAVCIARHVLHEREAAAVLSTPCTLVLLGEARRAVPVPGNMAVFCYDGKVGIIIE